MLFRSNYQSIGSGGGIKQIEGRTVASQGPAREGRPCPVPDRDGRGGRSPAPPPSIPKRAQKPVDSAEALKFFAWAYAKGDKMAEELDYVPMPPNVVEAIKKSWLEIKDPAGKPVYVATR